MCTQKNNVLGFILFVLALFFSIENFANSKYPRLQDDKAEFDKIKNFSKTTFGYNAICTHSKKMSKCCGGEECEVVMYTLNDGLNNRYIIHVYDGPDCDGRQFIQYENLETNIKAKVKTIDVAFDKIKKELAQKTRLADSLKALELTVQVSPAEAAKAPVSEKIKDEGPEVIYAIVKTMPEFPGGEEEMTAYIERNMRMPKKAITDKIKSKVLLKFVIDREGYVKDVTVVKGIADCPDCDIEAIRVISSMPKWTPGMQNGELVSVYKSAFVLFPPKKK